MDAAYRRLKLDGSAILTLDKLVTRLAELPLEFSPGTAWNYSVSTDVLGYLIQQLSDMPLDEYFRRYIFAPLGMDDTGFQVREDQKSRFAACYLHQPGDAMKLQDDPERSRYLRTPNFLSGGGGLVSTIDDYHRFAQALCQGGAYARQPNHRSQDTGIHVPQPPARQPDAAGAGHRRFRRVALSGHRFRAWILGQTGCRPVPGERLRRGIWLGGLASTHFLVDPKEALVLIFMTQLMPSSAYPLRQALRAMVYGALV